ncbi:MAG: hypothetical protein ACLFVB_10360 [Thermoplasmata archaeon]
MNEDIDNLHSLDLEVIKMFVKMYTYAIKQGKEDEFKDIQTRANEVYKKHIDYEAEFLRSKENKNVIVEIHRYPDKETYQKGMRLIDEEPELKETWEDFIEILDHDLSDIKELDYEEFFKFEN